MGGYKKLAARIRVPCGFLIAALYAWGAHPRRESLGAGLTLALAGLLLRAWAAGHLAKYESLATSGPFAYTRNPLYLGTLIVAAGFALASWNPWLGGLFALYFTAVYLPVIAEEESYLRKRFPEYADYAARVPRLVPRMPAAACRGRFRWALYRRNQEYQALAGYLAGAALLLWRLR
jgi:protein-S-isoprenylcysteine O-methyltransferase Ste14